MHLATLCPHVQRQKLAPLGVLSMVCETRTCVWSGPGAFASHWGHLLAQAWWGRGATSTLATSTGGTLPREVEDVWGVPQASHGQTN